MIEFDAISIRQGAFRLENVSFRIPGGAYTVLMGKTGCGKTTLIEILCGLRRPASGRIRLFGRDATRLQPGAREIGYVPQDQALFPHLSVRDNLEFALRIHRWPAGERIRRSAALGDSLGIAHLFERFPPHLSGGEKQRVALGRALAPQPRILCLDEPLSALDEDTHSDMIQLLRCLHKSEASTILHISHRRQDADELATHTLRMESGALVLEETHAHGI